MNSLLHVLVRAAHLLMNLSMWERQAHPEPAPDDAGLHGALTHQKDFHTRILRQLR